MHRYMNTHDKMFDFVSLRYLYRRGEDFEVKPDGDSMTEDIRFTHETTDSKSLTVGISGEADVVTAGKVMPSASVHVQKDNKITIERTMRSWRKGLSYESCRLSLCLVLYREHHA